MRNEKNQLFYESSVRFDAKRIGAAAVYCSDGRFGEQFDDLLHTALQLPRYDRLAVPGGAACLATSLRHIPGKMKAVFEQLRFLVNVHGPERVVLIAHENCSFYSERLHGSPLQLETQQRNDIIKGGSANPLTFTNSVCKRILCKETRKRGDSV